MLYDSRFLWLAGQLETLSGRLVGGGRRNKELMASLFQAFDANGDGVVDWSEFQVGLLMEFIAVNASCAL